MYDKKGVIQNANAPIAFLWTHYLLGIEWYWSLLDIDQRCHGHSGIITPASAMRRV